MGDDIREMIVNGNRRLLLEEMKCFTDLTIHVAGEKVMANAALVACRCEDILALPKEDDKKKKPKKHEVKLKQIQSVSVMNRILEYLYTGTLDFPKVPHVELLQVNAASRSMNLTRLNYIIEKWVKENLNLENAFHLLRAANDMKEANIRSFVCQFALSNYSQFISNKEGIAIIGIDLFQEIVAMNANPPPVVELTARPPQDTLFDDLKKLYIQMPYTDCSVVIENEVIRCHKGVLAAHSEVFASMLKESDKPDIKGVSVEAFKSLLRYIYYGDSNVDPLPACELVPFSRQYRMAPFQKVCEDKLRVSVQIDTVINILKVAYMPETEAKPELANDLKGKCVPFVIENICDINFEPLRMFPKIVIDILTKIQKEGVAGAGAGSGAGSSSSNTVSSSPSPARVESGFSLGSQRRKPDEDTPSGPPSGIPPPTPARGSNPPAVAPPPVPRSESASGLRRSGKVEPPTPPPGRDLPPPPPRSYPASTSSNNVSFPPPPGGPPPNPNSDQPAEEEGDKKKLSKKEEKKRKEEEEKKRKEEEKKAKKEKK